MEEILTMRKTMKVLVLVVSVFLCNAQANLIRNDDSKEISKKCYYCVRERQDVDNIAACSTDNDLDVEECSQDDHYDKCIVFQAFSRSKNTTIFKRECTSRRFCEERKICSDPDFLDCRYECCTGDLCNYFDFTSDVGGSRPQPQPTVAMSTRKYHELVQSGSNENVLTVTRNGGPTTGPKVQVTKSSSEGPTTRSLRTTSNNKPVTAHRNEAPVTPVRPVVEEDCEDLDDDCHTYVNDPSHWPKFCKDNNKYTSIACRKTCKFCISKYEVITTAVAPNLEDCKDLRTDCKDLKSLGYCELMVLYMKNSCGKTCEFCAGQTPVTKTTRSMTEKVTKSGIHGQEGKMGVYTVKVPVNTERSTTSRTDKITLQRTEKIITKSHPTTDSELQSGITLKPTTEIEVSNNSDCQDKRDNCDLFKAMDYCRIMTLFMDNNCRRTCGKCNDTSTAPESKTTSKSISHSSSSQHISEKLTEYSTKPTSAVTSSDTSAVASSSTSIVTSSGTSAVTSSGTLAVTLSSESAVTLSNTSPHTSQLTTVEAATKKIINSTRFSTGRPTPQVSSKSNILATLKETTTTTGDVPSEIPDKETNVTKTTRLMTEEVTTSGYGEEGKMGVDTVKVSVTTEPPTTDRTDKITLQRTEKITTKSGITLKPTTENELSNNSDCQDKRENCDVFKAMDYCRIMILFMDNNCRRTCGKCNEATDTKTTRKSESTTEATNLQSTAAVVVGPTPEVVKPPTPQQTTSDKQQTSPKPTEKRTTDSTSTIQTTSEPTPRSDSTTEATLQSTAAVVGGPTSEVVKSPTPQQTTSTHTDKQQTTQKHTGKQQTTSKHTEKQQTSPKPTEKRTTESTSTIQTTSEPTPRPDSTTEATLQSTAAVVGGPTPEVVKPPTPQQTISTHTEKQQTTPKHTVKQQTTPRHTFKQQTTPKHTVEQQTTPKHTDKQQTTARPVQTTPQTTPKFKAKSTTEVIPKPTPEPTSEPSPEPLSTSTEEQSTQQTSKSIIATEDCHDKRKLCAKFAKYPGYCNYQKEFMGKHCPKSCGFCGNVPSTPPPTTTRALLKTSPKVTTELPVVTSEPTPKITSKPAPKITSKPTQKITSEPTAKITSEPAPKITSEPTAKITSKRTQKITSESVSLVTTKPLVGGPTSKKENEKYDVVFVVGAQNPNASESFDHQKKLIQEILKQSTLTDLRYGLVSYNHEARTNIRMNGILPKEILDALLDLIIWQEEGTRADKGIKKALKQFGSRPEAKKRIVVFINGKSEASSEELVSEREKVESKDVKLIVVGMGDGYDNREMVTMAPDYEDRVYVDGTGPGNVTSELQQGAAETLLAIMQDDDFHQGGIPVEVIQIVGPENPETAKFGDTLRWKIWPWGECVDGKQSRVVRCYHLFEDHDYHVIIDACIDHVAPMADKERSC